LDPYVLQPLLLAAAFLAAAGGCLVLLRRRPNVRRGRLGAAVSAAGFVMLAAASGFVGLFHAVTG